MKDIQIFRYEDNDVRTMEINGEPWFVLKDVCNALEIANVSNVAIRLDADEKGIHQVDTLGGKQEVICRLLCRYTITIASTGWRHTGSNAGFTLCQPCVGAINKATSGVLTASHNIRLWRFLAWERRKASRIKRCLKKAFGRHWQGLNPVRFCGMANALKNLTGTLLGFSHIISE